MTSPNPRRQKQARAVLDRLATEAANCWIVHYSCESFYDREEGNSPRITSIAVRKVDTAQTLSFSIHQVAERDLLRLEEIAEHYDGLERVMLDDFFNHVGIHRGMSYVHWNMRENFGFAALEHRHRVLGGEPFVIGDDRKFDLARLLIDIYGTGYSEHPRLESLLRLNSIRPLDFMTGAQEAEAFEQGNYVGLHQSTLRKVDVIANILQRAQDRTLTTRTTWWEMHGGRLRTFVNWVGENPALSAVFGVAGLLGFALTAWAVLHAT